MAQYRFLIFFVFLFSTATCFAQRSGIEPVWSVSLSKMNPKIGETIEVIFKARWDSVLSLLSTEQPYCADSSILRSNIPVFKIRNDESFTLKGKVKSVNPELRNDLISDCKIAHFRYVAEYRQSVRIERLPLKISGAVYYLLIDLDWGTLIAGEWNWSYPIK